MFVYLVKLCVCVSMRMCSRLAHLFLLPLSVGWDVFVNSVSSLPIIFLHTPPTSSRCPSGCDDQCVPWSIYSSAPRDCGQSPCRLTWRTMASTCVIAVVSLCVPTSCMFTLPETQFLSLYSPVGSVRKKYGMPLKLYFLFFFFFSNPLLRPSVSKRHHPSKSFVSTFSAKVNRVHAKLSSHIVPGFPFPPEAQHTKKLNQPHGWATSLYYGSWTSFIWDAGTWPRSISSDRSSPSTSFPNHAWKKFLTWREDSGLCITVVGIIFLQEPASSGRGSRFGSNECQSKFRGSLGNFRRTIHNLPPEDNGALRNFKTC